MRTLLTRRAACDLHDITDFIARSNPQRARSFAAQLWRQCEKLSDFPLSHPARNDLGPGIRVCPYGSYLIIYRVDKTMVRVVRILHAARNVGALF